MGCQELEQCLHHKGDVMNWKKQLEEYEDRKDWQSAIEILQKVIDENSDKSEAYTRMIYLLHNILVEEDHSSLDIHCLENKLKHYYDESVKKFSEDAEYLFFIGKITHIAEWYFGINDRTNAIEKSTAFSMQKKALEKESNNVLFEWAYRLSLGDPLAGYLADQILGYGDEVLVWLKSKGFPGKYIIECLGQSRRDYIEN